MRDAQPIGGMYQLTSSFVAPYPVRPVLLYCASTPELVDMFKRVAPALAYGSVIVFMTPDGLPTENDIFTDISFRYWNPPGLQGKERCWIKASSDGGCGSHLLYLLAAVKATVGPVLELGCGDSSTPALHEEVALAGRKLVSIDNNKTWLEKFESVERGLNHTFVFESDPAESVWLNECWSVAFVDHAPGESRRKAVERLRDRAEFIVVHDTEDCGYAIKSTLASFPHRRNCRFMRPWTSILSMTRPIDLDGLPGDGQ